MKETLIGALRYVPFALCMASLLACLTAMLRLPHVSNWAVAYVACVTAFNALSYQGLRRNPAPESDAFYAWWIVLGGLHVVGSAVLACRMNFVQGRMSGGFLLLFAFGLSICVALIACTHIAAIYGRVPKQCDAVLLQAIFTGTCGVIALVSLMAAQRPEERALALWLGLYWIGLCVGAYVLLFGVARSTSLTVYEVWQRFNEQVPLTLTALTFGSLAMFYLSSQREVTRQIVEAA